MASPEDIIKTIRTTPVTESRLAAVLPALTLRWENGALAAEGEVADVRSKKLALRALAAQPGVGGILDRIRIKPAALMGDREIAGHLCNVLLKEPVFLECTIRNLTGAHPVVVHKSETKYPGRIDLRVREGVLLLDGEVPSLSHKRLAGVLAWWVPGVRDAVNGLAVEPPEQDTDDEITDAVRLALEKDPFVNASQLHVSTANSVVTLEGVVSSEAEKDMAEFDAWYVFAVDDVKNDIEVRR